MCLKIKQFLFLPLMFGNCILAQPLQFVTANASSGCSNAEIYTWVRTGEPPYTFQWDNGSTASYLTNLRSGLYCVTVTDSRCCEQTGCAEVTSVGVDFDAEIVGSINPIGDYICTGSADIRVIGNGAPFTFQWSDGAVTEDNSELCTGTYTVTITSAAGCSRTLDVEIGDACYDEPASPIRYPAILTVLPNVTSGTSAISNDGQITVDIISGNYPYYINWSGPNGFKSKSSSIQNLATGTYCVTITDGCGQLFSRCFTINDCSQRAPIDIAITSNGRSCNREIRDLSPGYALANATSGVEPYMYKWSNLVEAKLNGNLSAGTYCVKVTDARNCKAEKCINIRDGYSETQNQCVNSGYCDGVYTATFVRPGEGVIDDSKLKTECKLIVNCGNGQVVTLQGARKFLPRSVQLEYCVLGNGCECNVNGQVFFILTTVVSQVYTDVNLEDTFTGECPLGCKVCVERTICGLTNRVLYVRTVSLNRCPPPIPLSDFPLTENQIVKTIPQNFENIKFIRTKAELDLFFKEIKHIQIDGNSTISTKNGRIPEMSSSVFKVYPSPFENTLNLEYHAQENGNIDLEITNVMGQTVALESLNMLVGKNTYPLELGKSCSSGMYILKVFKDKNLIHSQKIIKAK
jgi:hypothetical protein